MSKRVLAAFVVSVLLATGLVVIVGPIWDQPSEPRLGPALVSPVWRTKIAFRSNREQLGSGSTIYLVRPDGSGLTKLISKELTSSTQESPTWSPDGKWLAFSGHHLGQPEILTIRAEGGVEVPLTNDADAEFDPVWSPDGNRVAFTSHRGGRNEASLFVLTIGGGLKELLADPRASVINPSWSPNGKRLAFVLTRFNEPPKIFVIGANGRGLRRILPAFNGETPSWSPDGKKLVFGGQDIWVANADGSNPTRLTHTKRIKESEPVWSPDGSMIAFTRVPPGSELGPNCDMCATAELWIMNSDGSAPRRVLENVQFEKARSGVQGLAWQPLPRKQPISLAIPSPSPIPSPRGVAFTRCPETSATKESNGAPSAFVGLRYDGRLVRARARDGAIEHVLATFARYPPSSEESEKGTAQVTRFSMSQSGIDVFFSTLPDSSTRPDGSPYGTGPFDHRGYIWHVCATGGEIEKLMLGQEVEVSPSGEHLAFFRGDDLVILDLSSGAERILPNRGALYRVTSMVWATDSSSIAFVTHCEECGGVVSILELDGATSLWSARRLGPSTTSRSGTGWNIPVFRGDGLMTVVEYCCSLDAGSYDGGTRLLHVDIDSGRVFRRSSFDRAVFQIDYDKSGYNQLILRYEDQGARTVVLKKVGTGFTRVGEGYLDVEW